MKTLNANCVQSKNFRAIFYLGVLLVVLLLGIACKKKAAPRGSGNSEVLGELLSNLGRPNAEKVELLAAKHQIGGPAFSNCVHEYLRAHDTTYLMFERIIAGEKFNAAARASYGNTNVTVSETLTQLSLKYVVPREKLAGAIADYLVWKAAESGKDPIP